MLKVAGRSPEESNSRCPGGVADSQPDGDRTPKICSGTSPTSAGGPAPGRWPRPAYPARPRLSAGWQYGAVRGGKRQQLSALAAGVALRRLHHPGTAARSSQAGPLGVGPAESCGPSSSVALLAPGSRPPRGYRGHFPAPRYRLHGLPGRLSAPVAGSVRGCLQLPAAAASSAPSEPPAGLPVSSCCSLQGNGVGGAVLAHLGH